MVERGFSVRDTELLVRHVAERLAGGTVEPTPKTEPTPKDVHVRQAEDRLKFALGTKVLIKQRGGKGVIEIEFTSGDELQRLYEVLIRA